VNIYDAVTGVLQQSLSPSEAVTKIEASPDGTTLFFAHSYSITMWDVQTGGLIHTFTTQSKIEDIAVSTTGDHIACGSSNSSVRFWNTRTKKEGKCFGDDQPVVTICWPSPQKLAVATENSLYIYSITAGETLDSLSFLDHIWGMVYSADKDEFLVGTSKQELEVDQELCSFKIISHRRPGPLTKRQGWLVHQKTYWGKKPSTHPGKLTRPTLVGKNVACITLPIGVQSFDTGSRHWTKNPPSLNAAASVAISLNRNLVAQTKDSIQIFSTDVLTSGEVHNDTRVSHVYPLGENHIICVLQPTGHLAVLELETLREPGRDDETLPFRSLPKGKIFKIPIAMWAWWGDTGLDRPVELPDEDTSRLVYGFSPESTKVATVHRSRQAVRLSDTEDGLLLAELDIDLGGGEVYDLIFDSETRFHLKIDRTGQHVQIPFDITPSQSGQIPCTITKGEPVPLSEPWATPPYTLDANCEWVLDAQSRRICWISPGNLRRGNGGHFWAGLSLVMVGDDGVVRKVSFREPDC